MARRHKRRLAPIARIDSASVEREDDYVNETTGIGDWLQDKTFGGRSSGLDFVVRFITNRDAENRWRGSDIGCRVVEAIPDEMTRTGWELSIQPEEDAEVDGEEDTQPDAKPGEDAPGAKPAIPFGKEDAFGGPDPLAMLPQPPKAPKPLPPQDDSPKEMCEDIEAKLEELGASEAILLALQYERAYGGAVILLGADDGGDLAKPIDEESIADVKWLNTFAGGRDGEVIAWSYYVDPRSPNYGKPEVYQIRNMGVPMQPTPMPGAGAGTSYNASVERLFYVHESRLLVFGGTAVSHRARVENKGWGDSIFVRCDEVMSQYSQTWGGIANLMTTFSQDVLKVQGNAVGMAGGDKQSLAKKLTTRARTIQQTKSIARMLVIDSEEEYERHGAAVQGAAEILQQFALRLAAAADMPVSLLMGQAPAGLNATGDSDIRFFYDRISARQKRSLEPNLKRLYCLIMKSKEGPCEGIEPEMWHIVFNPLYQMSEIEQATLRKTVAETDAIYIGQGVLSAEEVAASAYGGSEWTMERVVDMKGREDAAVQNEADQAEAKAVKGKLLDQNMKNAGEPQPTPVMVAPKPGAIPVK